MKNKKLSNIPRGWFDRNGMAAVLGVDVGQFDRRYRKGLASEDARTINGKLYFRARALIDSLVAESEEKIRSAIAIDSDPLLVGTSSPALERYRQARAGIAEVELAERRGEIVRLEVLQPIVIAFCNRIRSGIEQLGKNYGNPAMEIMNESVDEAQSLVTAGLKSGEIPGDANQREHE